MRVLCLFAACFAAAGCSDPSARHAGSPSSGAGSSPSDNNGTSPGGSNPTPGGDNGGAGPNCGVQNFALQRGLPPDLLIVLDRSGSMGDPPPAGGGSKWSQITAAIDATVMSLQGQIKWGLEMFPSDDSCGVSTTIPVPVATMNAAAVSSAMASQMPGGDTPTTDAIHAAGKYLAGLPDSNPKFLLLATDGEPNCATAASVGSSGACMCPMGTTAQGSNCCVLFICMPCSSFASTGGADDAAAEQAVADVAAMGINTFVVGIATDASADGVLDKMATNGKEPRSSTSPMYYPVGNQADLVTAINTIAGQIISCSFDLQMAPLKLDYLEVDADGQKISRDPTHANGWDYGPGNTSIQLYGSACTNLQNGTTQSVTAIYQCAPVS
jgi:hypothetical protein